MLGEFIINRKLWIYDKKRITKKKFKVQSTI